MLDLFGRAQCFFQLTEKRKPKNLNFLKNPSKKLKKTVYGRVGQYVLGILQDQQCGTYRTAVPRRFNLIRFLKSWSSLAHEYSLFCHRLNLTEFIVHHLVIFARFSMSFLIPGNHYLVKKQTLWT
jgi:hypothetical protein